jgi:hypothetical protein
LVALVVEATFVVDPTFVVTFVVFAAGATDFGDLPGETDFAGCTFGDGAAACVGLPACVAFGTPPP